jgi:hypothetical protein
VDIYKDADIKRVIRAQRKIMQIHRMAFRRRKMQVDIGIIRKRKESNVDIGN